ncbi:MAG: alkaline phosphatase family protein, partial [Anaerolineales bacterium]
MRNPYFFTRVLVLFFADVILELWQGFQQRRKNVQPRMNRLHKGYPFVRAAVNVFLRDIGTYFTILDILRGAPAMYTLYAGYDEIAHHSGPYYPDTNLTLRQFDHQVARIQRVIEEKASRPYEILLLSDHGQSHGATFEQRYGVNILEYIKQQLPQHATLAGSGGGDDGTIGVSAMLDELNNMHETSQGGRAGQAMLRGAQRLIKSNLEQQVAFQETKPANITVAYGGNGAQVYFDLFPRKITLNELNTAYPGMVDKLVQHEGIGFVVAFDDDLHPVAFGKNGARNLHTGDIVEEDPLLPYGDVDLRAWQLARMADFENAGDLILN